MVLRRLYVVPEIEPVLAKMASLKAMSDYLYYLLGLIVVTFMHLRLTQICF